MWSYLIRRLKGTSQAFVYIGIVGGFVADVLQPLAPFTNYLFFLASISVAVTGIIMVVTVSLRDKIFPFFVLSVSAMIFSAAIMFYHNENNTKSGVLAGVIPGVETLQSSLGIIKKDLAKIEKRTKKIEVSVEETQKLTKKIEESTELIIKTLEDIKKMEKDKIPAGPITSALLKDVLITLENIESSLPKCEGVEFKKWTDCQGGFEFDNKDIYLGEWKDGKFHGRGTYLQVSGLNYPHNSKWNMGLWVDPSTEWQNSEIQSSLPDCMSAYGYDYWKWTNCYGAWPWQDGTAYAGEWKDGKFHGTGTLRFSYPEYGEGRYVGEFINGKQHGKGTLYYADGSTEGEKLWKNGKKVLD